MDKKVDLKLIEEIKIKLIDAIYLVFNIPTRTQEENSLLKEIIKYSLMDQCGRYEERYQKLLHHLYILNGILYKHNMINNQGTLNTMGYSGNINNCEF